MTRQTGSSVPSLGEAARLWLKIGVLGFGGPAGQIALMHRLIVDEKKWIDEERFLHALNYCMLLPGPEAQQLAVYVGWLLHRVAGGLVAGLLFVLPGAVIMLALSILYVTYGHLDTVQGAFFGVKAAVLAIVVDAMARIGHRALVTPTARGVAVAAFAALFFFNTPFPLVVVAAALFGAIVSRRPEAPSPVREPAGASAHPPGAPVPVSAMLKTLGIGLALWFPPVVVVAAAPGLSPSFTAIGVFFSKMAVVTFGGAYAVLAYVAQQAVETYGWMSPDEMLSGLGLAETTPGPLIMVVQFVGFLGAYRDPGALSPMTAGVLGAVLTTWVTFVPCFIWIFLGAPHMERLRGNRRLAAAMSMISAAIVGVIANLALWFALHVLFATIDERTAGPLRLLVPRLDSVDVGALALTLASLVAILVFRVHMLIILAFAAFAGVAIATWA